jgi:DNA-binding SARP family transcriptional activator
MEKSIVIHENARVEFFLFDQVKARVNGQNVNLGSEKERCLVAALLLARGRSIPRVDLLDWLWEGSTPESAPADLDRYMVRLRKRLDALGLKDSLVNRDRQCRLDVPTEWVDVHRFRELVAEARTLEDSEAAARLGLALELSEGEPLAGLGGPRIMSERRHLAEERRNAELAFLHREMKLGRHRDRLPDLTRLHHDRPEDPEITALTMYALHLLGRNPDAMDVFARHRACLVERGFEVSQQIRDLQTRILRDDDGAVAADFPPPEPDCATKEEAVEAKSRRANTTGTRVINKVRSVRGDNIVFGVQNQVRP